MFEFEPLWIIIKPFLSLRNIGYAILFIIFLFIGWKGYEVWRSQYQKGVTDGEAITQKKWNTQDAINLKAYQNQLISANKQTADFKQQLIVATQNAKEYQTKADTARITAKLSSISLQSTLSTAISTDVYKQYISTVDNVLGQCQSSYLGLAILLDQYRVNETQLRDGWPTTKVNP
jgi:hypothetical protein